MTIKGGRVYPASFDLLYNKKSLTLHGDDENKSDKKPKLLTYL